MPRKPTTLASEFWVVDSVTAGRYHAEAVLRDLHCWKCVDPENEDEDCPDVHPRTRGAECMEYSEHSITVPVSPTTPLRPGMRVRISVEPV